MGADKDIVERLQSAGHFYATPHDAILYEAAAEIVRLRGVVPAWIATWMADREILPDDDGDGISEGALVEALNNHERELLNAHPSACELGAVREVIDRRKAEAEKRSRAGDGYTMGWSDGVAGFARELEAALQHRGDSRGGEG